MYRFEIQTSWKSWNLKYIIINRFTVSLQSRRSAWNLAHKNNTYKVNAPSILLAALRFLTMQHWSTTGTFLIQLKQYTSVHFFHFNVKNCIKLLMSENLNTKFSNLNIKNFISMSKTISIFESQCQKIWIYILKSISDRLGTDVSTYGVSNHEHTHITLAYTHMRSKMPHIDTCAKGSQRFVTSLPIGFLKLTLNNVVISVSETL